ncbi:hypothetical protein EIN_131850 [Entamoeba invadens IP1]|uniref:Uncharacterized protein n=1 Tax=Entamoeba invadens IP1 TaxID=370355 RepID=A0A0A1UD34_ENTIV|nr:hypothetical protein EIN_131850 [Entamoeba invadens IP1]ELP94336.1 hypothetical protein EIN_131850 [Entamoeba invadens IP1]|eukprot:XP_004261107.1 hypothetical protein EIN_131850 [Entamoeba invadens IP1]
MSFKPLKITKLEPVFMMSIIPHFISLNMLMRFHQVSRNCGESISRLKVNPCYQELSLETILQNDHSIHIRKELQIFTGIDSLHTDINTLQQLPPELLSNVKLFEISFIQKQTPSSYPIWEIIKDRVSRLIIDAQIIALIDLTALPNLRRLEIKAGRVALNENLPIRQIENLQTLVIFCDGNLYKNYFDLFEQFVCSKLRVLYKLNWLQASDLDDIHQLKPRDMVGIFLNDLPGVVDDYISPKLVLLYFAKKEFRIPIDFFIDKRLNVLLKQYHPSVLDIRGDVDNTESCVVDLHEEHQLEEITFNFVNCKEKIAVALPKELKKLIINKGSFLKEGGLLQLADTQVPKDLYGAFGDAVPN